MPSDERMEWERVEELEHDVAEFERYISKRYPHPLFENLQERAEEERRAYRDAGLRIAGISILIAIGTIIFLDGFAAGAAFVLTLVIGGYLYHDHSTKEPNFEDELDPLSREDKDRRRELQMRQNNPEYDRNRWQEINQSRKW